MASVEAMTARKPRRARQLGITDTHYQQLLDAQNGHCALCPNTPKTRRLHVDHDHATGRVRGLLCHLHNRALQTWMTVEWLDAAWRFLVRHELEEAGKLVYTVEDRGFTSPCWIWQRATTDSGYGVIRYHGELVYVHRLMCLGQIPRGYDVDHLCRQKACMNPLHLEAVTRLENTRRAFRLPTCKRGHPWTDANTYLRPDGSGRRQCRTCIRLRTAGLHRADYLDQTLEKGTTA